jgi:Arc/MetJ-type ribon-helix-helix transcriptional regulator
MISFQVVLPESVRAVIDARTKAGGFEDAADYLCQLVCEDRVGASVQAFQNELLERLAAEPQPMSDADVERIKFEIEQRRLQELRDEVLKGVEEADRGEVKPLDMEAITREGRKRMASAQVSQKAAG